MKNLIRTMYIYHKEIKDIEMQMHCITQEEALVNAKELIETFPEGCYVSCKHEHPQTQIVMDGLKSFSIIGFLNDFVNLVRPIKNESGGS